MCNGSNSCTLLNFAVTLLDSSFTKPLLFSCSQRLSYGKFECISNRLMVKPLHLTPFHRVHGRAAGLASGFKSTTDINKSFCKILWGNSLFIISAIGGQFVFWVNVFLIVLIILKNNYWGNMLFLLD